MSKDEEDVLSRITDDDLMRMDDISKCSKLYKLDKCIKTAFVKSVTHGQTVESVSLLRRC